MNRLDAPLWAYVGICLERRETASAISTLALLAQAYPDDAMLRRALVTALMEAHRYREALAHLEWLYAREDGKDPQTYHRYALALHLAGEFRRCLELCDEALACYPDFSQIYALRGGTWQVFGQFARMLEDCKKAVTLDPENLHARYALSLRELMVSGLTRGFEGYADRMFEPHEEPVPFFDLPSWEGESLYGKTLVLVWEQGIGDIVMFAGFVPYLLAQGASLILTVPQKLEALFARSFPECEVAVVRDGETEEALARRADYSVLMGQLMEYCLPRYHPADHPPYLKADPQRAGSLRARYRAVDPDKPYLVGVSWHTTNPQTGLLRNIPSALWRAVTDIPGVQCVSLQYVAQGMDVPPGVFVDSAVDAYRDLDALAAQMKATDEILTIQNATAHLAGALGVPTTLLLSSASDWRWGIGKEKGVWYDSVAILRQREPLAWEDTMREVALRIRRNAAARRAIP